VGSNVVRFLAAMGVSVSAISRSSFPILGANVVRIPDWNNGPAALDILRRELANTDTVIHLAGRAHQVRESESAEVMALHTHSHVDIARLLLKACEGSNVGRFIALSSVAAVTDSTDSIITESAACHPLTPYGKAKFEMENLVLVGAPQVGAIPFILRAPLIYGPGMKGNPLRLVDALRRGIPIPVSSPTARRSFLFIENLCQAIGIITTTTRLKGGTYFIADGPSLSVPSFIEGLAAGLGIRPRLFHISVDTLEMLGRLGGVASRFFPSPITPYEMRKLYSSLEISCVKFWTEAGETPLFLAQDALAVTGEHYRCIRHSPHRPSQIP
jgi:UDP-glucose 4-epimerase